MQPDKEIYYPFFHVGGSKNKLIFYVGGSTMTTNNFHLFFISWRHSLAEYIIEERFGPVVEFVGGGEGCSFVGLPFFHVFDLFGTVLVLDLYLRGEMFLNYILSRP